jgi:hypothetical protein
MIPRLFLGILGVSFTAVVGAYGAECDHLRTPLDIALCSDPDLRALAQERGRLIDDLWPRLSGTQQARFRINQENWGHIYPKACGLYGPPTLPLNQALHDCLYRAGRSRNAYLRRLDGEGAPESADELTTLITRENEPATRTDAPAPVTVVPALSSTGADQSGAMPVAPTEEPPSDVSSSIDSTTVVGSHDNNADDNNGDVGGWLFFLAISLIVILGFTIKTLNRRALLRGRVKRVCDYFDALNQNRRFPRIETPIRMEPGEFGLICQAATLWEMRSHRYRTGGSVRVARGVWVGGSQYHSQRQLDPIATGYVTITNRRLLFSSADKTVHLTYRDLVSIEGSHQHNLAQSKRRRTPVNLTYEDALLGLVLIQILSSVPLGEYLPSGFMIFATPGRTAGAVDLKMKDASRIEGSEPPSIFVDVDDL